MKKGKVVVIGLAGQSAFMTVKHFPQPGETVSCSALFFEPGGKGFNQAVACARMGVQTVFIGAVGEDANGEECRTALEREGITTYLIKKKEPTAYAVITTDSTGENTVTVFGGAAKKLQADDLLEASMQKELEDCDYLLLQNELSLEVLEAAIEIAGQRNIPVILNPAPAENIPTEILRKCKIVTPNYGEAETLAENEYPADVTILSEAALFPQTEEPAEPEGPVEQGLWHFFRQQRVQNTVITMGGKGVLLLDENGYQNIPAFTCGTVVDTTGAGDTFNGTLAAALAMGENLEEAVKMAVVAAGISVTRHGAAGSIPTKAEVLHYIKSSNYSGRPLTENDIGIT